jgi:molybdopterin/thiamine biosynthesis adenylyltransferase
MLSTQMNWSKFYGELADRNIGVISLDEQEKLRQSCIAVAGCGGMGGLSADQVVRLGFGSVKIADFDRFENHNLSRQTSSTTQTVGRPKTEVLSEYLRLINPEATIEVFDEGIQEQNAEQFVNGAGIVIDGIDYNAFYNTVLLHRAARKVGLCVLNPQAVGFGVSVLVFGPDTMSIEEYVGLPENATREEIENFSVPMEKFVPYFPSYADPKLAAAAAAKQINIPNIIMPQHLGTAIAVSEAVMILLGHVPPPSGPEPRIFALDLRDRYFEVIN